MGRTRRRSPAQRGLIAPVRGGARPIVLVLPGILGSALSDTADDGYGLIWVDPLGFIRGELAELKLTTEGDDADPAVRIAATDLLPLYYGDLIETLNDRGFDARPHYFDWRRDIRDLGARLATVIDELPAGHLVSLVAHSMGGLVSRRLFEAHPTSAARVHKLIMLGTPNFGSFSPASVLSGQEALLGWVAAIDLWNSRAQLIDLFGSFPAFLQMLPSPKKVPQPNFFAPSTWRRRTYCPPPCWCARGASRSSWRRMPARAAATP